MSGAPAAEGPPTPAELSQLIAEASPDEIAAILLALSAVRPGLLDPLIARLKAARSGGAGGGPGGDGKVTGA